MRMAHWSILASGRGGGVAVRGGELRAELFGGRQPRRGAKPGRSWAAPDTSSGRCRAWRRRLGRRSGRWAHSCPARNPVVLTSFSAGPRRGPGRSCPPHEARAEAPSRTWESFRSRLNRFFALGGRIIGDVAKVSTKRWGDIEDIANLQDPEKVSKIAREGKVEVDGFDKHMNDTDRIRWKELFDKGEVRSLAKFKKVLSSPDSVDAYPRLISKCPSPQKLVHFESRGLRIQ